MCLTYTHTRAYTHTHTDITVDCLYEGAEYTACGSACPLTCREPRLRPCLDVCVPGCQCPDGTFQDEATYKCVRDLEECSNGTGMYVWVGVCAQTCSTLEIGYEKFYGIISLTRMLISVSPRLDSLFRAIS